MNEEALLLMDGELSPVGRNLAKVLRFFGVTPRIVTVEELLTYPCPSRERGPKSRLFCSSDVLSTLLAGEQQGSSEGSSLWRKDVHSAFVYAGNDFGMLQALARRLSGDNSVIVHTMDHYAGEFVVSVELPDFCGVMAGVRIGATNTGLASVATLGSGLGDAVSIISTDLGATFLRVEHQSMTVFLSTSEEITDLDTELVAGVFDIRDHVLSALPVVLYVKWAFGDTCWNAPGVSACLVIDDPLLKTSYGFVDFNEFLSLMKRHRFSTNVAFIPWNWRRSTPDVVHLFRENPDMFSVSVHGCDHTRAEFGSRDAKCLRWKAEQAIARMGRHKSRTGIHHDPVMVFPQGMFSEAAMDVLKQTGFIAVVNNDTVSGDPQARPIRVSEFWDVAVMGYHDFPIFTRRYPWAGIENFAFDILLGKPCVVSIHHDFCSDHCGRLVDFVGGLNALNCSLAWRSLGEVVRRGYRQKATTPDAVDVEMYGTEARIENESTHTRRFVIWRREGSPSTIREIQVDLRAIAWEVSGSSVRFEVELAAHQTAIVRLLFHGAGAKARGCETAWYKVKTMLRRLLSEARDNYVLKYRLPFVSRFARIN